MLALLTIVMILAPSARALSPINVVYDVDNVLPSAGQEVDVTVRTTTNFAATDHIVSLTVDLAFQTTVFDYLGTTPCSPAGLTFPGNTVTTNPVFPEFNATCSPQNNITGTGCIIVFRFRVKTGTTPGSSGQFLQGPHSVAIDKDHNLFNITSSPSATVTVPVTVSGRINYWHCGATDDPAHVGGVLVTIHHPGGPQFDDTDPSDPLTGQFIVRGVASTSSDLESSRLVSPTDFSADSDVRDAIDAADVSLIAGAAVHIPNSPFDLALCPLDADHCNTAGLLPGFPQKIAADVNQDGVIDGFDESQVIGLIDFRNGVQGSAFPSATAYVPEWQFFCSPRTIALGTSAVVYNPTAVLPGDVTGNYHNTGKAGKVSGTVLSLGRVATRAARVVVPVEIRRSSGMLGFDARIVYDANVLRFVEATAPFSATDIQVWGRAAEGVLSLIVIGKGVTIEGTRNVANLVFERVDPSVAKASSPLLVSRVHADGALIEVESGAFTTTPNGVQGVNWSRVKALYR